MKPIKTQLEATGRLFDAQAIVGIVKDIYLDGEGQDIDRTTIGRALEVAFELMDDVAEFVSDNMEVAT